MKKKPDPTAALPGGTADDAPSINDQQDHIGQILKNTMPPNCGFVLIMTELREGGHLFYTSSLNRKDAVKVLNEFLEQASSDARWL